MFVVALVSMAGKGNSRDVHEQMMDLENVIHMHNGILLFVFLSEILMFAGEWSQVELIVFI